MLKKEKTADLKNSAKNLNTQGFKADIAIVGTGPAGIYCALQLIEEFSKTGKAYSITLFDGNSTLSSILPTGNGRCNLTYDEEDFKNFASNYPRGEKFLYSIFSRYSTTQTRKYFEKIGVETYVQPDRRVFPVSNSAKNVRTQMISALSKCKNVKIVKKFIKSAGELDKFSAIVLATGSKDRCKLAEQFGHSVIPLKPALCGLCIKELTANFPTGVSLNTDEGGIIFTHQGVSGPYIFKISSLNAEANFPYTLNIPLLKADSLIKLIQNTPKKSFGNIVSEILPKALTKYVFELYSIDYAKQACHAAKKDIKRLETLTLTVTGTDGRGEIVHCGGVCLNEVDKNCRSKVRKNLWIIGESLNIDGFCGGFNLQNCWSTGAIAAQDIVKTALNQALSCI